MQRPILITALGRSLDTGKRLTGAATKISLWEVGTVSKLVSVLVGPQSRVQGGHALTSIPLTRKGDVSAVCDGHTDDDVCTGGAVHLKAGSSYRISMTVTNGMPDKWCGPEDNVVGWGRWYLHTTLTGR